MSNESVEVIVNDDIEETEEKQDEVNYIDLQDDEHQQSTIEENQFILIENVIHEATTGNKNDKGEGDFVSIEGQVTTGTEELLVMEIDEQTDGAENQFPNDETSSNVIQFVIANEMEELEIEQLTEHSEVKTDEHVGINLIKNEQMEQEIANEPSDHHLITIDVDEDVEKPTDINQEPNESLKDLETVTFSEDPTLNPETVTTEVENNDVQDVSLINGNMQNIEILNTESAIIEMNDSAAMDEIVSYPVSVNGVIQIPIDLPEWADLSQQNLVAVTEDGTTIPLTFIQDYENDKTIMLPSTSADDSPNGSCIQKKSSTVNVENVPLVRNSPEEVVRVFRHKPVPKSLKDVMAMTAGVRKKVQPDRHPIQHSKQPKTNNLTTTSVSIKANSVNKRRLQNDNQDLRSQTNKNNGSVVTVSQAINPTPVKTAQKLISNVSKKSARERDDCKIELSNVTKSAISSDNMETLIQILHALPVSSRGQPVQIILQSDATDGEEITTTTHTIVTQQRKSRASQAKVSTKVQLINQSQTTNDIGTQVTSDCLDISCQLNAEDATNVPSVTIGPEEPETTVETNKTILNETEEDNELPESSQPQKLHIKSKPTKKIKKKFSKVITVEQQWVVDPQPGVSYFAVVDYLSEQEQDGYSSGTELRRPEAAISGFMEDYLELQDLIDDAKASSLLESTIDSSVVVPPIRRFKIRPKLVSTDKSTGVEIDLPNSELTQSSVTLNDGNCEEAASFDSPSSSDVLRLKKKRRFQKACLPRVRHQHCCGYCEFGSREKILVVEHCILQHPDDPVKTLSLLPQLVTRVCPYCRNVFESHEFFSHMRFAHNEFHPYKCGYCDFMGRDRNQIRHHIQKKHKLPVKIINLQAAAEKSGNGDDSAAEGVIDGKRRIMGSNKPGAISEGEDSVYEYMTDEDETEGDEIDNQKPINCPECKKSFKTLRYLKTHVKIHQSLRYQCGYCDFTTVILHQVIRHCQMRHADCEPKVLTKELEPDKHPIVSKNIDSVLRQVYALNTRLPRDPDAAKWMRKWCCPHCDYACQFGASYRRHLRMHANLLPYKCNYCSFKGREKYYVRRHIYRMHKGVPMIVIENTPENCEMDSSSDEDFQEKGLRRKRKRKMKGLKPVVPLDVFDCHALSDKFQKLPVGERGLRKSKVIGVEPSLRVSNSEDWANKSASGSGGYSRLPRPQERSGEKISDYILGRDGDKIICKVCGQKTCSKSFYKHARKHFRVKPFKCGYCNYMSVERAKIRVHNTIKHPNAPFRIEECHLASILPREFMDLIGDNSIVVETETTENIPTDDKSQPQQQDVVQVPLLETPQFDCAICQQAVYYEESALRDHFYSHYEYYPFACNVCDFRATTSDRVVEHEAAQHDGNEIIVYQVDEEKPEGLEETILQYIAEGEAVVQQRLLEIIEQTTKQTDYNQINESKGSQSSNQVFECHICDKQMNLHVATIKRHFYSHFSYKPFKCGYCDFQGVSKANIKQHTVTHGSVAPIIEMLKDLPMPENLENVLRNIQASLKMTLIETKNEDDLVVKENFRWREKFSWGLCPSCDVNIGRCEAEVRSHLVSHLEDESSKSKDSVEISCSNCDEIFESIDKLKVHHEEFHPDIELSLSASTSDDKIKFLKDLIQFMDENKDIFEERLQMSKETNDNFFDKADGSTSALKNDKEVEYQVVILSDDKETVIPVTKMGNIDSATSECGQSYALVLEQGDDGTVRAAKMIEDKPEVITNEISDSQSILDVKNSQNDISGEIIESSDENDEHGNDILTVGGVLLTRGYCTEAEDGDDEIDDDDEVLELNKKVEPPATFEKSIPNKCSSIPKVDEPSTNTDDLEETVENITKMVQDTGSDKSELQDTNVTNKCGEKRKLEDESTSNSITHELNLSANIGCHKLRSKRRYEIKKDILTSNAKVYDVDDVVEKKLENLEECDENLPKILRILNLKPTKDNRDNNPSET